MSASGDEAPSALLVGFLWVDARAQAVEIRSGRPYYRAASGPSLRVPADAVDAPVWDGFLRVAKGREALAALARKAEELDPAGNPDAVRERVLSTVAVLFEPLSVEQKRRILGSLVDRVDVALVRREPGGSQEVWTVQEAYLRLRSDSTPAPVVQIVRGGAPIPPAEVMTP